MGKPFFIIFCHLGISTVPTSYCRADSEFVWSETLANNRDNERHKKCRYVGQKLPLKPQNQNILTVGTDYRPKLIK